MEPIRTLVSVFTHRCRWKSSPHTFGCCRCVGRPSRPTDPLQHHTQLGCVFAFGHGKLSRGSQRRFSSPSFWYYIHFPGTNVHRGGSSTSSAHFIREMSALQQPRSVRACVSRMFASSAFASRRASSSSASRRQEAALLRRKAELVVCCRLLSLPCAYCICLPMVSAFTPRARIASDAALCGARPARAVPRPPPLLPTSPVSSMLALLSLRAAAVAVP